MIVEPVLRIIEQSGLGLVAGQNLFAYFMPGDVLSGVVVLPTLAGNHISYELFGFRKDDTFQVLARAGHAEQARDRAWKIQQALIRTKQVSVTSFTPNVPSVIFSYIRANHDPIVYPRQLSGEWEASVNYAATYAIQGIITA